MKSIKKNNKKKTYILNKTPQKISNLSNSSLKINVSEYSRLYKKYLIQEYPNTDIMIKKIIQLPCCEQYYLKFPLESLLRGVIKKMMLNQYEMIVFGYFLEQIEVWSVGSDIYSNLADIFPDIIHVNQPTCPEQLKQISMFLCFSSYSVKQFLNEDIEIYTKQMKKILPQFDRLHTHWVNNQPTVNFALNPRNLNIFYNKIHKQKTQIIDYNTCVDKILQISPCYDLSNRDQKKKLPQFGYMQSNYHQNLDQRNNGIFNFYNNGHMNNQNYSSHYGSMNQNQGFNVNDYAGDQCKDQDIAKIQEIADIDMMDFQYDGGDI